MPIVDSSTVQFKIGKLPVNMADRLKYLYRLQEKLRIRHNVEGKKYRDGDITLHEFRLFQERWYEPRSMLIANEIGKCKAALQKDTTVICNIGDIEEKQ